MKKVLYYFISIIFVILCSLVFAEIILQIIPIIYRNLPNLKNEEQYIYVIGESSARGEPYNPKISYYKIFNYMVNGKINNKKIKFIVIAKSGNRIHEQFYKYFIYKYTHPFKKGIVFIYGGKNDWDNGLNRYNFNRYIGYNIFYILNDSVINILSFKNRRNRGNFKYNYERIILLAKKFEDDVFVSTIEGNYAGFMPHLDINNASHKKQFQEIDEYIFKKNYQKALFLLNNIFLRRNIDKSWILYRIGKIYEFTGKNKEANDNFIKAVGFYTDLRPTQHQNDVIRELATKYNVELVDIFDKLYNSGEIIGFNFYMDNQHPNLKTYIMIAKLFVDAVSKKYNVSINMKRYNTTEQEIFKNFNFNKRDQYKVYRNSLDVTLVHSKDYDNSNIYVFDKVNEYLKQVDLLNPYDEKRKEVIMSFYNMMYEALKGNKEKVKEIFNDSHLINIDKNLIESRTCDWEEYNNWVSDYLGIQDFFDLSKRYI
jgi:hypothetical protein